MDFETAQAYLDSLQMFKIKLGLEAMDQVLADLGSPHRGLPVIHLAGTNGKGSVGAALTALYSAAGLEVGFYSSPHLDSPRERFRIGNRFIGRDDFARIATTIRTSLRGNPITYFEFTTALALQWFAERRVDLAVIEVGMGGRLDATNVVTPLVSVITNISLDHEQYLGNTVAAIAFEKAGIIKPGIPVVCGVEGGEALPVIERACRDCDSRLHRIGRDFAMTRQGETAEYHGLSGRRLDRLPLVLPGEHQLANLSLALAATELLADRYPIDDAQLRQGLSQIWWPGRQEVITPQQTGGRHHYLIDGAHNPDGIASLHRTLKGEAEQRSIHLVWAAMSDKNSSQALLSLLPLAKTCTLTHGHSERFSRPADLLARIPEAQRAGVACTDSVAEALETARGKAEPEDLICVAGSLYLVGEARAQLLGPLVQD